MRMNGRNHLAWGASAVLSFSLLATTVGFADDKAKDNDAADAAAICEAVVRSSMRFPKAATFMC